MDDNVYVAHIPRDLADLVPVFLKNRHQEISDMRAMLRARAFDDIAALAQRMIGVGTPYGFAHVTSTARVLLETARRQDVRALAELLNELERYLKVVKMKVV
ncbi:MAG: hypothetical protein ACM30H_14610 [Clostridia bacterium]